MARICDCCGEHGDYTTIKEVVVVTKVEDPCQRDRFYAEGKCHFDLCARCKNQLPALINNAVTEQKLTFCESQSG